MSRRVGAGAAASFLAAAMLAVGCVVLTAGAAQATPLPVQVSFVDLMPGDVRSTSWPVQVPVAARIASSELHNSSPGGVQWSADLCPAGGGTCIDLLSAATGTPIAAGDYLVRVGLTVTDLLPSQSRTLDARYTLAEASDGWLADTSGGLADTGVPALALGLTAVGVAALGVVLVVLARRSQDEPENEAATAPDPAVTP